MTEGDAEVDKPLQHPFIKQQQYSIWWHWGLLRAGEGGVLEGAWFSIASVIVLRIWRSRWGALRTQE